MHSCKKWTAAPLSPVLPCSSLAAAWKDKSAANIQKCCWDTLISASHAYQVKSRHWTFIRVSPWAKCLQSKAGRLNKMAQYESLSAEPPFAISLLLLYIPLSCAPSLYYTLSTVGDSEWGVELCIDGRKRRGSQQGEGHIRIQSLPWPIYLQPGDR